MWNKICYLVLASVHNQAEMVLILVGGLLIIKSRKHIHILCRDLIKIEFCLAIPVADLSQVCDYVTLPRHQTFHQTLLCLACGTGLQQTSKAS